MNSPATNRERLLKLAGEMLRHIESGRFAKSLSEAAPAEAPQASGVPGEIVARSLNNALDWARLEGEARAASGGAGLEAPGRERPARPYFPSNQTLSLLQSAYEEFVEDRAAEAAGPGVEAPFDGLDPGWVSVAWERLQAAIRGKRTFIKHTSAASFRQVLPDDAVVALYSDWGTGEDTAKRVMRQIRAVAPTHAVHLGDVYYSGTKREVTKRFLDVIAAEGPANGCRHFALNSNHEMYSGGYGYFDVTLPKFGQEASYFNLQTAHFQLIGVDSGYEDHGLHDPQDEWLGAQLQGGAGGRKSILLSHHQLFSPYESRAYDRALHRKIQPLLGGLHAWFWGHEHRCIVFGDHLGIKARCIGHGAIPEEVPYGAPQFPAVPVVTVDERVAPGTNGDNIHGFALLRFAGPTLTVSYIDEFGTEFFQENL